MANKRTFIFTNRKHPQKGVMSTVLGIISATFLGLVIYGAYEAKGETIPRYGTCTLFVFILAMAGLVLGMISKNEPDRYKIFPWLGILLNGGALAVIVVITYIAVYM